MRKGMLVLMRQTKTPLHSSLRLHVAPWGRPETHTPPLLHPKREGSKRHVEAPSGRQSAFSSQQPVGVVPAGRHRLPVSGDSRGTHTCCSPLDVSGHWELSWHVSEEGHLQMSLTHTIAPPGFPAKTHCVLVEQKLLRPHGPFNRPVTRQTLLMHRCAWVWVQSAFSSHAPPVPLNVLQTRLMQARPTLQSVLTLQEYPAAPLVRHRPLMHSRPPVTA